MGWGGGCQRSLVLHGIQIHGQWAKGAQSPPCRAPAAQGLRTDRSVLREPGASWASGQALQGE